MEINIKDLLTEIVSSPPVIYHKLQTAIANPESSFEDFEKIILADTALSARLLKIANSSFFGFEKQVDSVKHALSIIGLEQVSDLVLVTFVISKFDGIPHDLISMEEFWHHSIACGVGARIIGKLLNAPNIERFYLGGILHDIGSLVICKEVPVKARLILSQAKLDKIPLFVVESEELGFNHGEIGGALLKAWKLPDSLVELVQNVHQPHNATLHPELAAAVHLADCMAYQLNLGSSGEPTELDTYPEIYPTLNLKEDDLFGLKQTIQKQYKEVVDTFL